MVDVCELLFEVTSLFILIQQLLIKEQIAKFRAENVLQHFILQNNLIINLCGINLLISQHEQAH